MWGRKKPDKSASTNPEVQDAMDKRDALIEEVRHSIEKAADATELLRQYAQAERRIRWR